jgi:hypothetical protein
MRARRIGALAAVVVAVVMGGCHQTVDGLAPVGGDQPSAIEQQRFLKRLHLDLTGAVPAQAWIDAGLEALAAGGDTAITRAALADELIASRAFADVFVGELGNRVFAGESTEARFGLLCSVLRNGDPACISCGPPTGADACAGCACPAVTAAVAERAGLAAADLAEGRASTAAIERRHAEAGAFRSLAAPEALADQLFRLFLGRPVEPDERLNVRNLIIGLVLTPSSPAGLLFHRHGSDYGDLMDILFESEIYREAAVAAVFWRYLGRAPTPVEQAHFADTLDAADPDVRPVIRAVVSSREYFYQ